MEYNYFFSPGLEPYWVGYYDFILNVLFPDKKEDFKVFNEKCIDFYQNTYLIIPFDEICFISERPTKLSLSEGRLHSETGPAIQFKDGYSYCALNGIQVPEWLFDKTMDEKNKVIEVLKLTNTEQRMASMKYLGMANFLDVLGAKMLDKYEDYRLYSLEFEGATIGPYLYMECPSTGRQFLEGVGDSDRYENFDPTIKTCEDALLWRIKKASNGLFNDTKLTKALEFKA